MLAKADVSNQTDIDRVFKEIKETMPPLKGIQHAAMVLDDGGIPEIDYKRYMSVFIPKAVGCWLLHEATKTMELEHFVSYSSISAIYGNPGQVSYVGANSFLDNFSWYRRSIGLPAMTINWGVIGEVGFVSRSGNVGGLLYKQGWKQFSLQQALGVLEQMLLNNPVQRVATDSDWEMIGSFFPHSANSSRFAHLIKEKQLNAGSSGSAGSGALKATILESKPEEQKEILLGQLKDTIARVLGTTGDKVDTSEPVTKYGLDSLMANQIRNWIQSNLAVDYSMMRIMRGPTMEEMTIQIIDELHGQAGADTGLTTERSELDKWIIRYKKVEHPRLRLFCMPYFAGGASIFSTWHEFLPDDIEVCAVQFPGREERGDEKPYDNVQDLMKKLGENSPQSVRRLVSKMGIDSNKIRPYPSICLGSMDLSVFEMVGAYSTFANEGEWVEPIFITRIEDKYGNILEEFAPKRTEAMRKQTAYALCKMMELTTLPGGTASRMRSTYGIHYNIPIAGKTGTTQNNSDGWFIGVTPDLVSGAWVGCEDRQVHFRSTALGQGGHMAMPIFAYYMKSIYNDRSLVISQADFKKPDIEMTIEMNCEDYSYGYDAKPKDDEPDPEEGVNF